jgi:hypothetical protein
MGKKHLFASKESPNIFFISDVAILLTRHDICRATNKCDTLGLAELGTMCDAKRSCAIIEDNGQFWHNFFNFTKLNFY